MDGLFASVDTLLRRWRMSKVVEELQKSLFSKMDKVIEEYVKKEDTRRATAFAFKMKEVVSSFGEIISAMNIKAKSDKEKEKILKEYHKKMEDMIPIIQKEIEEMMNRENQIPNYIGFIFNTDERRLQ